MRPDQIPRLSYLLETSRVFDSKATDSQLGDEEDLTQITSQAEVKQEILNIPNNVPSTETLRVFDSKATDFQLGYEEDLTQIVSQAEVKQEILNIPNNVLFTQTHQIINRPQLPMVHNVRPQQNVMQNADVFSNPSNGDFSSLLVDNTPPYVIPLNALADPGVIAEKLEKKDEESKKGLLSLFRLNKNNTRGWEEKDFDLVYQKLTSCNTLRKIIITDIPISSSQMDHIILGIKNKSLVEISLQNCQLNDELIQKLLKSLIKDTSLQTLNLSNNPITDNSAQILSIYFELISKKSMLTLNIQNTDLSLHGLKAIFSAIKLDKPSNIPNTNEPWSNKLCIGRRFLFGNGKKPYSAVYMYKMIDILETCVFTEKSKDEKAHLNSNRRITVDMGDYEIETQARQPITSKLDDKIFSLIINGQKLIKMDSNKQAKDKLINQVNSLMYQIQHWNEHIATTFKKQTKKKTLDHNEIACFGMSALSFATHCGNLEAVRCLLEFKADPTLGAENCPLMVALRNQHDDIITILARAGCFNNINKDSPDSDLRSLSENLINAGNVTAIKLFQECNPEMFKKICLSRNSDRTFYRLIIEKGHIDLVIYLLSNNLINALDARCLTKKNRAEFAPTVAANHGHVELERFLITPLKLDNDDPFLKKLRTGGVSVFNFFAGLIKKFRARPKNVKKQLANSYAPKEKPEVSLHAIDTDPDFDQKELKPIPSSDVKDTPPPIETTYSITDLNENQYEDEIDEAEFVDRMSKIIQKKKKHQEKKSSDALDHKLPIEQQRVSDDLKEFYLNLTKEWKESGGKKPVGFYMNLYDHHGMANLIYKINIMIKDHDYKSAVDWLMSTLEAPSSYQFTNYEIIQRLIKIADCYLNLKCGEKAKLILEKLYKKFEYNTEVIECLMNCYKKLGLNESNKFLYNKTFSAAKKTNDPELWVSVADYQLKAFNYDTAEETLCELYKQLSKMTHRSQIKFYTRFATLFLRTERLDDAWFILSEALKLYKRSLSIVLHALTCLESMGLLDKFYHLAEQVKSTIHFKKSIYIINARLAKFYLNLGLYSPAKTLCDEILKTHPKNVEALFILAEYHNQVGDPKTAIDILLKLDQDYPSNIRCFTSLLKTCSAANEYKLGLQIISRADNSLYIDEKQYFQFIKAFFYETFHHYETAEGIYLNFPLTTSVRINLSRLYLLKHQPDKAAKILDWNGTENELEVESLEQAKFNTKFKEFSEKSLIELMGHCQERRSLFSVCKKDFYARFAEILSIMDDYNKSCELYRELINNFPYNGVARALFISHHVRYNKIDAALVLSFDALKETQFKYDIDLHKLHLELLILNGDVVDAMKHAKCCVDKFYGNTKLIHDMNKIFINHDIEPPVIFLEMKQESKVESPIDNKIEEKPFSLKRNTSKYTGIYIKLPDALEYYMRLLLRLNPASYPVGGSIVSAILGRTSQDIDIVTQVSQETVLSILTNSIPIKYINGLTRLVDLKDQLSLDIVSTTIIDFNALEKDAFMRGDAASALYLDYQTGEIIDPTGNGLRSLITHTLMFADPIIGNDPKKIDACLTNNPKLMMRYVRSYVEYGLVIPDYIHDGIKRNAHLILEKLTYTERLALIKKTFTKGKAYRSLTQWFELGIFQALFPHCKDLQWLGYKFSQLDKYYTDKKRYSEFTIFSMILAASIATTQKYEVYNNKSVRMKISDIQNLIKDYNLPYIFSPNLSKTDKSNRKERIIFNLINTCFSYYQLKVPTVLVKHKKNSKDVLGMYNLANYYQELASFCGFRGRDQEHLKFSKKAFFLYQKAAQCADASGEVYLALAQCYKEGKGVEVSSEQAFVFFEKSASTGNAIALFTLAGYYDSNSSKRDLLKAFASYKAAAEKNHVVAMRKLGDCYQEGYAVEKDLNVAIQWFLKAAYLGDDVAQFAVGRYFENPENFPEFPTDHHAATLWYIRAANQKNKLALEHPFIKNILANGRITTTVKESKDIKDAPQPTTPQPLLTGSMETGVTIFAKETKESKRDTSKAKDIDDKTISFQTILKKTG